MYGTNQIRKQKSIHYKLSLLADTLLNIHQINKYTLENPSIEWRYFSLHIYIRFIYNKVDFISHKYYYTNLKFPNLYFFFLSHNLNWERDTEYLIKGEIPSKYFNIKK
ncbi:hypothetical protein F8160_04365 [Bacillus sp. CH126_4D]|nr:hypothetical protein F8162_21880 [Bacillus sp. CH140a_4T]KAB2474869.1 hypothetical protein F8160_04365 [Bacillus sp. CH126_4D]